MRGHSEPAAALMDAQTSPPLLPARLPGESRRNLRNDTHEGRLPAGALTTPSPATIEAGLAIFRAWESTDAWDAKQLVREIYESMAQEAAKAFRR